jgi:hypothetical protein
MGRYDAETMDRRLNRSICWRFIAERGEARPL